MPGVVAQRLRAELLWHRGGLLVAGCESTMMGGLDLGMGAALRRRCGASRFPIVEEPGTVQLRASLPVLAGKGLACNGRLDEERHFGTPLRAAAPTWPALACPRRCAGVGLRD